DAASDKTVVALWVLGGGDVQGNRMSRRVLVGGNEHRLDTDHGTVDRHVASLVRPRSKAAAPLNASDPGRSGRGMTGCLSLGSSAVISTHASLWPVDPALVIVAPRGGG